MNKQRRADLERATILLNQAAEMITQALGIVETARDEEQEYYDNMPENMQSGDKGERAQEAANELDTAVSELEGIDLESILGNIEAAVCA